MFLHRIASWLGFGPQTVVGLHIGAQYASIVALRPRPLQLRAVGRQVIFDAAMGGDEDLLLQGVAAEVAAMVTDLRLEPGTAAVATIEPLAATLLLSDGDNSFVCDAGERTYDRLVAVVKATGLELLRLDPVPLALARVGLLGGEEPMAIRSSTRWSVLTGNGHTTAERSSSATPGGLWMGSDLDTLFPVDARRAFPGIRIPRRLRHVLDADRDAPAVGAALGALGRRPLAKVVPQSEPTLLQSVSCSSTGYPDAATITAPGVRS